MSSTLTRTAICFALALWGAKPLAAQLPASLSHIAVDAGQRFQVIDGLGVNFNGTYFRNAQKPMIDMFIDDLGATIFRLDPYGLSNWEAVNDNDDPNVMNWEYYNDRYSTPTFEASWAAARYLNARGTRPFLTLSGTVPQWMLSDKMIPGRKVFPLNPAMYEEFAEEIVSLLIYARTKARIDFNYFSPVNETDGDPSEGPPVEPGELPKLLTIIARRMRKEGVGDVKLVVADQAYLTTNYIGPILEDDELMKQVGAFSFHTYGESSVGPQVEQVKRSKYPGIPVWVTEYGSSWCVSNAEGAGEKTDRSAENDWKNFSLAATRRALRALNQGASAALFWDAYDNYHEHCPCLTFYGLMKNADHIYSPKKRYYAAKQLFHFVRPGSQRIEATAAHAPGLMVSAFRNGPTDSLVVVGVKQGGPNRIQISVVHSDPVPSAWELYETTRNLDCVKVGTLPIRNGVAEFDLPDEAIITLVSTRK